MTPEAVISLARSAIEVTLLTSAPLLLAALAVGLLIRVFQAATQINEMTLSFIPKLAAVFIMLVISGPWMLTLLTDFMRRLILSIPSAVG